MPRFDSTTRHNKLGGRIEKTGESTQASAPDFFYRRNLGWRTMKYRPASCDVLIGYQLTSLANKVIPRVRLHYRYQRGQYYSEWGE